MTITIDLTPEVEAQLREEAAKVGMEEGDFILNTLQERVCRASVPPKELPPRLSREESELLLEINKGLPEELWHEYDSLVVKRRAETLTPEEHCRLIEMSDHIEITNARRIELLIQLARIQNTTLDSLMKKLGIGPRPHA